MGVERLKCLQAKHLGMSSECGPKDVQHELEALKKFRMQLAQDLLLLQSYRSKSAPKCNFKKFLDPKMKPLSPAEKADLQEKIDTFDDEQLSRAFSLLREDVGTVPEGLDEVNLDIDGLSAEKQRKFMEFVHVEFQRSKRRRK